MDTKGVRIELECETILRKYSEGSLSDCIRAMEAIIRKGSADDDTAFKEEVRTLIKDFDYFIKHGQGGIRVYPMKEGQVLDLEEPLASRYEEYQKPQNKSFVYGVDKVDFPKEKDWDLGGPADMPSDHTGFKTAAQLKEERNGE
jgi:hypothetical protein